MPRAAALNSCRTCLTRKIKCDGALPLCVRCDKQGLFCDRSSPLAVKQYRHNTVNPAADEDDPRMALKDRTIARLFHIYIKELAPWYDLNDLSMPFATLAPTAALSSPLLFSAIIAFAGTFAFRKYRVPISIAEVFHSRCLRLLISLSPDDESISNGIALAATCLLRSYEILAEREDPNRHLFGASTILPPIPELNHRGLLACGYWNYLREDITYALVHRCPLKVRVGFIEQEPVTDDEFANHITLLLAAQVNAYFGKTPVNLLPAIEKWKSKFPAEPFSRCDDGTFPMIRMLKDCHVAAMHYYYIAMCLINPNLCTTLATEICGLAMSSESDPVIVNAYGPICFSARWIVDGSQRQALTMWLKSTQKRTVWFVDVLISKLQQSWSSTDQIDSPPTVTT